MSEESLTAGLFRLRFRALGTQCEVQFRTEEVTAAKEYRAGVLSWLQGFENTWSRFKHQSLLSKINALAGKEAVALTEEQEAILRLCDRTYKGTEGLIEPTSLPLTLLWDQSAAQNVIPSDQQINEALKLVQWGAVQWGDGQVYLPEKGMALELGGFGKEYAVDVLIALADRYEIDDVLVDLGRDLATKGQPPHGPYWVVGVEDARQEDAPALRLAFANKALATSGNGRRYRLIGGKRFGHIIDPRSGHPVENEVLTATCLASDCLTAGWFSTSACILGVEQGKEKIECQFELEGFLQTSDAVLSSQGLGKYVLKN